MTPQQRAVWQAIQVRLRHGGEVGAALEEARQAGIAVRVVRHYLGNPGQPRFGQVEDVSRTYGLA